LIFWNYLKYVERRTYRSLKSDGAWTGFKIAKKDGDLDKMKFYAEGIQKFERQICLSVSDFTDIFEEAMNGPRQSNKTEGEEMNHNR
jgi:hypothetical protein